MYLLTHVNQIGNITYMTRLLTQKKNDTFNNPEKNDTFNKAHKAEQSRSRFVIEIRRLTSAEREVEKRVDLTKFDEFTILQWEWETWKLFNHLWQRKSILSTVSKRSWNLRLSLLVFPTPVSPTSLRRFPHCLQTTRVTCMFFQEFDRQVPPTRTQTRRESEWRRRSDQSS